MERSQNIQDVFLNKLRKAKTPVTIFLANGVKLQGHVGGFDNFCVLLRRGPQMQLVYKHTIATVVPSAPINLYEDSSMGADETMDHGADASHNIEA